MALVKKAEKSALAPEKKKKKKGKKIREIAGDAAAALSAGVEAGVRAGRAEMDEKPRSDVQQKLRVVAGRQ